MKNFYLKMISILFLGFIGVTTYAQEWNFSSASFSALGSIATTMTVEGLTIYAATGAEVVVDASNKTVNEFTFTSRLKTGGAGAFANATTPTSRVLSFGVTGNTTITIIAVTSSPTSPPDPRYLNITAGDNATMVGQFTLALSSTPSRADFNYVGGPTTIFLYSTASGINLYYVKAALVTVGINDKKVQQQMKIFPNPATENVSIDMNEPGQIGIYNTAGILMKQQLASPDQNSINISDLNPGLYFVKAMNNSKMVQKLIVR